MLARAIEQIGLPTTTIVLIREHAERVKPPRALFVPFPFGFALGKPEEPEFQHKVIAASLLLLKSESVPVLSDFPENADAPARLLQSGEARTELSTGTTNSTADEVTRLRGYYERWVEDHNGRTSVGLSGIPQRKWRGSMKYMQAYATGETTPFEGIPPDVSEPRFIRMVADDIKAFYL